MSCAHQGRIMITIHQIRHPIGQYCKRQFSAKMEHSGMIERKSVKRQFIYFDQRVFNLKVKEKAAKEYQQKLKEYRQKLNEYLQNNFNNKNERSTA